MKTNRKGLAPKLAGESHHERLVEHARFEMPEVVVDPNRVAGGSNSGRNASAILEYPALGAPLRTTMVPSLTRDTFPYVDA